MIENEMNGEILIDKIIEFFNDESTKLIVNEYYIEAINGDVEIEIDVSGSYDVNWVIITKYKKVEIKNFKSLFNREINWETIVDKTFRFEYNDYDFSELEPHIKNMWHEKEEQNRLKRAKHLKERTRDVVNILNR